MEKHKILIAGLPDTGKSTFIGALWAIVRNYSDVIKSKMKASDSDVPDLVEKLDNLGEAWECVRYIKRSSEDIPENMRIELVTADEEIGVTLDFPDFRGESFRNIISQNQPKTIDDWCEHADSLLFFINDFKSGTFYDDIKDFEEDNDLNKNRFNQPGLSPELMTPATQNMLILRYLKEHSHFKKVTICITQWDRYVKIHSTNKKMKSPEVVLQKQSPALYNFIKYHFPQATFYGLSSQGDEYKYEQQTDEQKKNDEKLVKADCKKRLLEWGKKGQRAFICWDKEYSFDITSLIYNMLF